MARIFLKTPAMLMLIGAVFSISLGPPVLAEGPGEGARDQPRPGGPGGTADDFLPLSQVGRNEPVPIIQKPYLRAFAFSPDGKLLATTDSTKEISLWEVPSGKKLRRLQGRQEPPDGLAFSPDGPFLAVSTWLVNGPLGTPAPNPSLSLWDLDAGKELTPFDVRGQVTCLPVFVDKGTLVACHATDSLADGQVACWQVPSGKLLHRTALPGRNVRAFAPDGRTAAGTERFSFKEGKGSNYSPGTVRLWDTLSGKRLRNLVGHPGYVSAVAFSADGRLLASGDAPFFRDSFSSCTF